MLVLAVDNPKLAGQHSTNNEPSCTQRGERLLDYSTILYDVEDGILTITLNRPEALNAFTNDMMFELINACDRADADDNVKAIIVTGAGRGFCAGADLSRGASTFDSGAREDKHDSINRDGGGRLTLRIYELNKPIIAAVNGAAVGVGVTMTLAMDIRLASSAAKFGFVFARRGIVPEACSSYFLPRAVVLARPSSGAIRAASFQLKRPWTVACCGVCMSLKIYCQRQGPSLRIFATMPRRYPSLSPAT